MTVPPPNGAGHAAQCSNTRIAATHTRPCAPMWTWGVSLRPSKIIPLMPPIITELINNNNYSHYYRAGIPIIREPGQRGANRHVFCTKLTKICILLPDRPPQKPLRSDFQSPKTFSEQKGHIFSTEFTRQSVFPNLTRFFSDLTALGGSIIQ